MTDLPPAPDLELRLVRYFIAVAEQRHFGRAAEALHITQPSLSRQVRRLEDQLGARLLDRTPQGTRLTEAGEVFLPRAKALLRSTAQAAAETRAAAQPGRLIVGYMANLFVTPAVRDVRRRHPDADVHVVHLAYDDVRTALLDRRVDVVVARLPFPTGQLDVSVLYDEPRFLLVPLDHRLAGKESVTLDDIADEPLPQMPGADPAWSAFWRIDPGRTAARHPVVRSSGFWRTSSSSSPTDRPWRSWPVSGPARQSAPTSRRSRSTAWNRAMSPSRPAPASTTAS